MVTIIFESHGTSLDNEAHLSSGWFNVELSELGQRQAVELGERHRDEQFAAIFCSDLQRSYRTAEIAFLGRGFPIIQDQRLRECDYGELTRHSSSEVEPKRGEYVDIQFPGGQSYEQTADLIKSFLRDLLKNYDGQKVMIIGHRATQYGLEHWISGVPLQEAVTVSWAWQPGWMYKLKHL